VSSQKTLAITITFFLAARSAAFLHHDAHARHVLQSNRIQHTGGGLKRRGGRVPTHRLAREPLGHKSPSFSSVTMSSIQRPYSNVAGAITGFLNVMPAKHHAQSACDASLFYSWGVVAIAFSVTHCGQFKN